MENDESFGYGEGYARFKKKKRYRPKKMDYSKHYKEVRTLYEAGHTDKSIASYLENKTGKSIDEETVRVNFKRQKKQAFNGMYGLGLKGWAKGLEKGDMKAVKLWFRNKLDEPLLDDVVEQEEDDNAITVTVNLNKDE